MKLIKSFTTSVEKVTRYILPGAYLVLLYYASQTRSIPDSKFLIALVVGFLGPSFYLFYREIAGVVDDIVLKFHAGDTKLSEYKAELYKFTQQSEVRFQSYMYYKFSGAHHGVLLSLLTITITYYATYFQPRQCFLTSHFKSISITAILVLFASFYNYLRLHAIQNAHWGDRKGSNANNKDLNR